MTSVESTIVKTDNQDYNKEEKGESSELRLIGKHTSEYGAHDRERTTLAVFERPATEAGGPPQVVLAELREGESGQHTTVAVIQPHVGDGASLKVTETYTTSGDANAVVVAHEGTAIVKEGKVEVREEVKETRVEVSKEEGKEKGKEKEADGPAPAELKKRRSSLMDVMSKMRIFGSSSETTSPSKHAANGGEDPKSAERTDKEASSAAVAWLSKARNNIKYTFISKETEEAFAEIGILFDKFFDDFPYNKIDLMFGLMMIDDYYRNAPILTGQSVLDIELVETFRYYMRFAYCCYGWKFIYGILNKKGQKFVTSMVGDAANLKALHDCTKIDMTDVLVHKWTSTLYDPGHYICLCREKKTIVVAFRGTFHIRDCLTDLVASNTPFMHGYAHTGFLRAAKNKYQALAGIILRCYEENPTYKVVVVGHSLGAGTASLFTLLFHQFHPAVPLHCYAYAPPCVLSPDVALSADTQGLIDSIVVGDDIVPRTSFENLNHLKRVIMDILAQGNNTFQRAFHWMSGGMGDGTKRRLSGFFNVPMADFVQSRPPAISDISVFPPGRLFHLVPLPPDASDPQPPVASPPPTSPPTSPRTSSPPLSESSYLDTSSPPSSPPGVSVLSSPPPPLVTSITSVSSTTVTFTGSLPTSSPATASSSSSSTPIPSTPLPPSPTVPSSLSTPPINAAPSINEAPPINAASSKFSLFKSKPKKKTQYVMEYSSASLFNEIIISPTMFGSHMPSHYDKVLARCLARLKENHAKHVQIREPHVIGTQATDFQIGKVQETQI